MPAHLLFVVPTWWKYYTMVSCSVSVASRPELDIGHSGNIYTTETGKRYKPTLDVLFHCLSRLEKVMEKMLIMQMKLSRVSSL